MLYMLKRNSYSGLKVSDPLMYYISYELSYIPYAIYVQCNSYSGVKVSDAVMNYILYELSYILYAIYVSLQFLFGSESFRPHYVSYII